MSLQARSLIWEIKKYPCLYNNTVPEYYTQDVRELAWREVGRALNRSVIECMENWHEAQISYELHLKSNPKTKYNLAKEMAFILPFINSLDSDIVPKSYTLEDVEQQLSLKIIEKNLKKTFMMEEKLIPRAPKVESSDENVIEIQSESDNDNSMQEPPATDRREPSPQAMFESVKSSSQDSQDDPEKLGKTVKLHTETNKVFLLSLLPSLNEMTDNQIRLFKMNSLQIVDDILEDRKKT